MIFDAGLLRGWPKERAELYGKPHLGARYTHDVSATVKTTNFAIAL